MLTDGPHAIKGSHWPLVKKMRDECHTALMPKLQNKKEKEFSQVGRTCISMTTSFALLS